MRLITSTLENVNGISIYPIISLTIFIILFAAITIAVMRADKTRMKIFGSIPLDDNEGANI